MDVVCEMMKLKPEYVKDYIELHNNIWPDLVTVLRELGFIDIYILDNLVMVIFKCENFEESNAKAKKMKISRNGTLK